MLLPLSSAVVPSLSILESVPSTNSELVRRAGEESLPAFAVVVTDDQTAGRGRLDRRWTAPAGSALAISVLIRPDADARVPIGLGWIPIAAGVSMTAAVRAAVPSERAVGFKWPNDVQIDGAKVCGILAEVLADGTVVVGAGLNTRMTAEQLPVPTATSLALSDGDPDPDPVLARYLTELRGLVTDYLSTGSAAASGLLDRARADCTSIGRQVRVQLPGGNDLVGTAIDLDADGRLLVRDPSGRVDAVAAGDITHVR